ncbi:MAG TPA: MFS transporter, partial [Myxococcales bacterium]|nr:MFS transporter [Myxococcales bacterium]
GMISGGGFLVYFSAEMGWYGLFVVMGGLVAAVFSLLIFFKEAPADPVASSESMTLSKVFRVLLQAVRTPAARWLLITVATYKLGESLIDGMFKLYLLDSGYTVSTIALWVSTYGMAASILGSVAGGVLAMRIPLWRALFVTSTIRILPLIGIALLALGPPSDLAVIGLTLAEHFCGGALTTVMFATMMSHIDSRIGATHFTVLATVEVLGKSPGFIASGFLAAFWGYPALFGLGALLSLAFLLILLGLKAHMAPASGK